jgi:hypothetical protein
MTTLASRTRLWPVARMTFGAALSLFVVTIVIGILNGLDLYTPDHDTLITHVHAGTLGWITLAVAGTAFMMFSADQQVTGEHQAKARVLGIAVVAAIGIYVAAFLVGDRIPGDRIQRPLAGTLLLGVLVWFLVWMLRSDRRSDQSSVARLGLILAWVSLLFGAVLGIILGLFAARGEVPGIDADTASRLADAHPPAMVIGFLIPAAMAITEWLIRPVRSLREDRAGTAQMWIVFAAGVLLNVAFIVDSDALLGPANGLQIVAVVMLVVRLRRHLVPSAWRGAGTGVYARLGVGFVVVNLVVITYLVSQIMSGSFDPESPSESDMGLLLTLDHLMFIGVMTNTLFGVVTASLRGAVHTKVDTVVWWGVNVGLVGFGVGLATTTQVLKRLSTPVMGAALLYGIWALLRELRLSPREAPAAVS